MTAIVDQTKLEETRQRNRTKAMMRGYRTVSRPQLTETFEQFLAKQEQSCESDKSGDTHSSPGL